MLYAATTLFYAAVVDDFAAARVSKAHTRAMHDARDDARDARARADTSARHASCRCAMLPLVRLCALLREYDTRGSPRRLLRRCYAMPSTATPLPPCHVMAADVDDTP